MLDRRFELMGPNGDHHLAALWDGDNGLRLLIPGDPVSVREALSQANEALQKMDVSQEHAGAVEIVLAEALNNVVEHSYAGHASGLIELSMRRHRSKLTFMIRDEGHPMPGGGAPGGQPQALDVSVDNLPEGGFGWFLIRALTQDLRYRRDGDRNELRFEIPLAVLPQVQ